MSHFSRLIICLSFLSLVFAVKPRQHFLQKHSVACGPHQNRKKQQQQTTCCCFVCIGNLFICSFVFTNIFFLLVIDYMKTAREREREAKRHRGRESGFLAQPPKVENLFHMSLSMLWVFPSFFRFFFFALLRERITISLPLSLSGVYFELEILF